MTEVLTFLLMEFDTERNQTISTIEGQLRTMEAFSEEQRYYNEQTEPTIELDPQAVRTNSFADID